jgi:Family of unknown function (DUF6600)/FecR protein
LSNAWNEESAMNKRGIRNVVFGAILLAAAGGLWAADHYKVVNGPSDFYYGHISYIEAGPDGAVPTVVREGKAEPEAAVVNLPIGPGDIVRTTGDRRVEIQFDTGTIVRLDFATEFAVETVLARSLSRLDEITVMRLDRGRIYVQYREYDRKEMFQVLTPNAAVRMKHNSVVLLAAGTDGATEAQVKYGQASVRFGPDAKSLDDKVVVKGQRLMVLKDHQSELATALEGTAFELWNNEVNAKFWQLHDASVLPKSLEKLPPAIFFFAQSYGRQFGDWLYDDLYGYVWRPFIDSGAYPWGWQPYYYGRWGVFGAQEFWIPGEPWGWIPYHLGVWQWSKKIGWVWLPGSLFAPSWAMWDFYYGYACWRPWGLYDWMNGPYSPFGWGFNRSGFYYGDGAWNYGPYTPPSGGGAPTVIRRDQLRQPEGSDHPVPAEFRRVLANLREAYNRGNARVREDAADTARHLVFVDRRDLGARAIEEKALTWDKVPKAGPPADGTDGRVRRTIEPQREASRILRGLDRPAAPPRPVAPPPAAGTGPGAVRSIPASGAIRSEAGASRFRDWNPDVRVARALGAHIEYSAVRNEIRCPELGFSSRDRVAEDGLAPRLTSRGIAYEPASSVEGGRPGRPSSGSGESGYVGSSAPAGSSQASGASRGGTQGGQEAKGGEGGKIKK